MVSYIEKIVQVPEPDSERFNQIVRLLDALGWSNYYTHYDGEDLDEGNYGDDVTDYTILVPDHQLDIFEFLMEIDAFDE